MNILVTGASGFVGKALSLKLLSLGHNVRVLSRRPVTDLVSKGAVSFLGDVSAINDISTAFDGVEAVFHIAAKVDMWGDYEDFFRTNVLGTENVIALCRKNKISNLVFTSSPSVIADGSDLQGIDESFPYPEHYEANYPKTKSMAEQLVIAANDESLRTIALRPHLIFGPGDTNLIPAIIERARQGKLVKIGSGNNKVDFCFIEDCVDAHLAALTSLMNNPATYGKKYFISQGEPMKLWEFVNLVLASVGLKPITKSAPKWLALKLASIFEMVALVTKKEPRFTRFLVSEMSTDHYFSIAAARRDLAFNPQYSMAQALEKTLSPMRV